MRVMIVDDEPFIREGLKQLIEASGHDCRVVAEAGNGLEALDKIKTEKIDLMFVDIKMPAMSGLEMIERIKKYNLSDAQIVILTGFADFDYARTAMRNNITYYLLKPVQVDELEKVLIKTENCHIDRINQIYRQQKKILQEMLEDEEDDENVDGNVMSDILSKQKDINFLIDEVRRNNEMRKREKKEIGYEVDKYVAEHYRENISLKQIGEIFFVNNVYLGQLFKKRHNMLFKDYITSLRMADAEDMLLNTNKRIYQISEELGFTNADIFISKFVQLKGITPNQYRIKNRMKSDHAEI
ncbi:Helix-turn-helix domain-containing protein [Lachnospiraceae bacterium]|nr:Helix-turn-helix domain-containing protein [Lachnospiraceae bacterium]